MSRSKRKQPFRGFTTSDSEKQDKLIFHRRMRRGSKQQLQAFDPDGSDDLILPDEREVSDIYNWAKDGRQRVDPIKNPELMRK